jgi:hypothetical protein
MLVEIKVKILILLLERRKKIKLYYYSNSNNNLIRLILQLRIHKIIRILLNTQLIRKHSL